MYGYTSAIVGLMGTTKGMCSLSLSAAAAERIVRSMNMLPEEDELAEIQLKEGIAELATMIAREARSYLSNSRYQFDIAAPIVISGPNHDVFYGGNTGCSQVLFETDQQDILALEIRVAIE